MKKALVLHSGGQDSTTCLLWALKRFDRVEVISFDYGQRHKVELRCAKNIARRLKVKHTLISVGNIFNTLGSNALTNSSIKIKAPRSGKKTSALPNTFVPGRNIFFLSVAAAYAYNNDIHHLVTGVCQTDYSGYPDCRDETIKAMQKTLRKGMNYDITIHTPLMFLNKAQTVKLMRRQGGLELLRYTHTCYEGKRPACGKCPACLLRIKGFKGAKVTDPLEYGAK